MSDEQQEPQEPNTELVFDSEFLEMATAVGKSPMETVDWLVQELEIERDRMLALATGQVEMTPQEAAEMHLRVVAKLVNAQLREQLAEMQQQARQEDDTETVQGGANDGLKVKVNYTETDWTEDPSTMMVSNVQLVTAMSTDGTKMLPVAVFTVLDIGAENFKEQLQAHEQLTKAGIPEQLLPSLPSKRVHLIIPSKQLGMRMVEEVMTYSFCPDLMAALVERINAHTCTCGDQKKPDDQTPDA